MNLRKPFQNALRTTAPAVVIVGLAVSWAANSAAVGDDRIDLGRELFERQWTPQDPYCETGDGLGPMYNANSCVACHHLGSPGGGWGKTSGTPPTGAETT